MAMGAGVLVGGMAVGVAVARSGVAVAGGTVGDGSAVPVAAGVAVVSGLGSVTPPHEAMNTATAISTAAVHRRYVNWPSCNNEQHPNRQGLVAG